MSLSMRPKPGWAHVRQLTPKKLTAGGLHMGKDMDNGKVGSAVGKIIAFTPARGDKGNDLPACVEVGDHVLFREFLRHAVKLKDMDPSMTEYDFLMDMKDFMAVVGPGTYGTYGEFVVE